jgi:hypothetical protein
VEALSVADRGDIRLRARREIVESEDLPALVEQKFGKVYLRNRLGARASL